MKKTRLLSLVGVEVSLSCHGQTPAIVGCVIYYRQTTGWTVNYHVTDSQPVFVSRVRVGALALGSRQCFRSVCHIVRAAPSAMCHVV